MRCGLGVKICCLKTPCTHCCAALPLTSALTRPVPNVLVEMLDHFCCPSRHTQSSTLVKSSHVHGHHRTLLRLGPKALFRTYL